MERRADVGAGRGLAHSADRILVLGVRTWPPDSGRRRVTQAPETIVRAKQDTQSQLDFQSPVGIRATVRYFARYEAIRLLLDRHPEILALHSAHLGYGSP